MSGYATQTYENILKVYSIYTLVKDVTEIQLVDSIVTAKVCPTEKSNIIRPYSCPYDDNKFIIFIIMIHICIVCEQ